MGNPWTDHVKAYAAENKISYACALSDPNVKATYEKEEKPEKQLTYNQVINIEKNYTNYDNEKEYIRIYKDKDLIPYQAGFNLFMKNKIKPKPLRKDSFIYKDVKYNVEIYDISLKPPSNHLRDKAEKKLKEPKEPKIPKAPKVPKEPKPPKTPKVPKAPKEPKPPKEKKPKKEKINKVIGEEEGLLPMQSQQPTIGGGIIP
jgi:hypothetical protein